MKSTIRLYIIGSFLIFHSLFVWSQTTEGVDPISVSRNKNIKHQLDFRFKGGSGEFEKIFFANVEYTDEARKACVMGVTIMSFKVGCDNKLSEFKLKNPLGSGLDQKMGQFFGATAGQWNACSDEKYTRFEIPVLFRLERTETGGKGFLVVDGKYPGVKCKSDAEYLEIFEKLKSKKKTKKALRTLDELMKRDPYNTSYFDLKKAFLEGNKEGK